MYGITIIYPRKKGSTFNLDHLLNVHAPMGLALLKQRFEVQPRSALIQKETYGPDGMAESASAHVVCTLVFETQSEADKFLELFQLEEPRRLLSSDWSRYTEESPILVAGELVDFDLKAALAKGPQAIEAARREFAPAAPAGTRS